MADRAQMRASFLNSELELGGSMFIKYCDQLSMFSLTFPVGFAY
jgi:hypothetical protein